MPHFNKITVDIQQNSLERVARLNCTCGWVDKAGFVYKGGGTVVDGEPLLIRDALVAANRHGENQHHGQDFVIEFIKKEPS